MKLAKSLLLGSAAGLVAVTGAQAADLPVRAAAPVDYVRICPFTQADFDKAFVIPNTETCLQIEGYARADYIFIPSERSPSRLNSDYDFDAKGYIEFDARTPTAFGTLRSFLSLDSSSSNQDVLYDEAFIQFAGLTAGKTGSFFDYQTGELMGTNLVGGDGPTTELIAYTAVFGAGFSASVSLEEARDARTGAGIYGGQEVPALVANLNVSQGWGSAQIMGALLQNRHNVITTSTANDGYEDELGYAIGGGASFNLPFAGGSELWLQGTYAKGAIRYLDGGLGGTVFPDISVGALGDFQLNATTEELEQTEGWVIAGAFIFNWAQNIAQRIQASYGEYDIDTDPIGVVRAGATRATVLDGTAQDYTFWTLGTRLDWEVVDDLTVSGEVQYIGIDASIPVFTAGITDTNGQDDDGLWEGRIRIQRNF